MAISASFIHSQWLRDMLKQSVTMNWGGTSATTLKIALFSDSLTGADANLDPATYGVTPYLSGVEVYGTGWAAGGVALGLPGCTITAGVGIKLDADDVSQANTTLTNAKGALIYASSTATKYGILLINFGANYSTNNGTFGIQFDATNGIATIDLTPA